MDCLYEAWINQLTIFDAFSKNPSKLFSRTVSRKLYFTTYFKMAALLLWLITPNGCTERDLTRATPQMDAEPQFWIRVLLLDDSKDCALKIHSAFSIISPQTQTIQAHFDQVNTPLNITISEAKISIAGWSFTNNEIIILPQSPYIFNLNGNDYRGKLKLTINPGGGTFDAVNVVPLEPYLAGVIGAEMPGYWELAALKAQAIAARTYCLYIKRHFGTRRNWDVRKTQAHQVYLGVNAESAQIWNAINRTHGRILVCEQTNGAEDIFPAYYSSVCGGYTENSRYVFGQTDTNWAGPGPLAGVICPYCKDVAKHNLFFWPAAQFEKTIVTEKLLKRYPKLKKLGKIERIIAAKQSDYGEFSRLTLLKLLGSTGGSDFLRAEDFRLAIDPTGWILKSAVCKIIDKPGKWVFEAGRGYGHGVGMCQCGAEGMARKGKTAKQILAHYYPGSKIVRVYRK